MNKTVRRVETLYSYKMPDGSLLPRGVYTVDSPRGIPDMIMQDAISGRTTVKVLEWGAEEKPKKASAPVPEVITTLDEEEVVETIEEKEEKPLEVGKPKKSPRKRK